MTAEETFELSELVQTYESKRLLYENLGYLNTAGKSFEERQKMHVEYNAAYIEMQIAFCALNSAKHRIINGVQTT